MKRMVYLALALAIGACGNGSGDDDDVADAAVDVCGFASDRYLPYEVGFTWEWRVTDLTSGAVETKSQVVQESRNHPDDGLPMLVQLTQKGGGSTENWMRMDGDALVRLQQLDYNALDQLLRSTVYDPSAIRLDETPARLAEGTTFTESYTEIEYDSTGTETRRASVTEEWEVVGVDVACDAPLGAFECLHVSRTRTAGGIAQKQYWFARGVGKVREEGGQIEQLTACSTQ